MPYSNRRSLRPADDSFPYALEVNDHTETDGCVTDSVYPRYGWACLWRHDPDEAISDANPYPEVYIQEQSIPETVPVSELLHDDPTVGIALQTILHPYRVSSRVGWDAGPERLWSFFEAVRDEFYEAGVNVETLPIRVVLNRSSNVPRDSEFSEVGEIYFRNGANDTEYVMWNSNELYHEGTPNSELVQTVISAFAAAYEEPDAFLDRFGNHAVDC